MYRSFGEIKTNPQTPLFAIMGFVLCEIFVKIP